MPAKLLMINPKKRKSVGKKVTIVRANPKRKALAKAPARKAPARKKAPLKTIKVRRNPSKRLGKLGVNKALIKSVLVPAVVASVGATVIDIAMGYANKFLPAPLQSGIGNTAIKGVVTIGAGLAASKVKGAEFGKLVMIGGLTVQMYMLMRQSIQGTMPAIPLAGLNVYDANLGLYDDNIGAYDLDNKMLGFYSPATIAGNDVTENESYVSYDDGLDANGNFNIMDYSQS